MKQIKIFRYDGEIFTKLNDHFVEVTESNPKKRWFKKENKDVVREINRITKDDLRRSRIEKDKIIKVLTDPISAKYNNGEYPLGFSMWYTETDKLFQLEIRDVEIKNYSTKNIEKETEFYLGKQILD